jgi:hypothetical protein
VTEPIAGKAAVPADVPRALPVLRNIFEGALIANGGYDAQSGNAAVARGETDLVAFGVPFLANPDLPLRYLKRAPLNTPNPATFYAGEEMVLAAVRIRAKMAKNLTDGRRTGGAAVGCGLSDRKFDCLLPTIGL